MEGLNTERLAVAAALALAAISCSRVAPVAPTTYCNPVDLDYTYAVYDSDRNLSYRSGADPAVVGFKGKYYMFVTRSLGYWVSDDLMSWRFINPAGPWYPQGCNAPAAHNYGDSVLYVAGDPSGSMSILHTGDPENGRWEAEPAILHDLQDPDLFIDDDGSAYMFWGSSNVYPIRGKRLNRTDRFLVDGPTVELISIDPDRHGWERFGENHSDPVTGGYIEGPWLTKHDGKYYLQYAAPGTEFNVYGDGVYVADSPLGPYEYQAHNPFCYKGGGFMNGAGHGSTVQGPGGQWWHFGSMSVSAVVNWERRICMFPTFFDDDGVMWSDTEYGDYPHYAPSQTDKRGAFTGWMLLSYGKEVEASSSAAGSAPRAEGFSEANTPETSPDFAPGNMTDENCKTYWMAEDGDPSPWFMVDLGLECEINALQINYFDHMSGLYGRPAGLHQRYVGEASSDKEKWSVLEDKSISDVDAPNAYIELSPSAKARYVRYRNIEVSTPHLAISGFRVFGKAPGEVPGAVSGLTAVRSEDGRDVRLEWAPVPGAQGYNVRWGISADKLYSSWLIYGDNSLTLRCLSTDQEAYAFQVEAFGPTGVGPRSGIITVKR